MIENTIALLGLKASDKVTGFSGVITSACFDLYGCVQLSLTPPAEGKDKVEHGAWFDVNRLTVSEDRVMPVPAFTAKDADPVNYDHGAAPKPPFSR